MTHIYPRVSKSNLKKEEDVEKMNETNLPKTIEYLWDSPKSFSIIVVGFALSLAG